MNGITYFIGNDSVHGAELWRTDGTTSGTYMVKDICPGAYNGLEYNYDDAFYSSLNQLGSTFYFFADTGQLLIILCGKAMAQRVAPCAGKLCFNAGSEI